MSCTGSYYLFVATTHTTEMPPAHSEVASTDTTEMSPAHSEGTSTLEPGLSSQTQLIHLIVIFCVCIWYC